MIALRRCAPLLTALTFVLCAVGSVAGSSDAGSRPALAHTDAEADRAAPLDDRLRQAGFTGAVLVAQGDTVVLRGGYGLANAEHNVPNTTDTKFDLGSVTKPFTAMAVLALQERGRLSVTDPICRLLDGCPPAWREITVHHLLTHTSGMPEVTRVPGFYQSFGGQLYALPRSTREVLGLVRPRPLDFTPGERWQYSNTGYIALGEIIQTATGTAWHEFMGEAILRPAGLRDTGFDVRTEVLMNRASGYEADARGRLTNAAFYDPSNSSTSGGMYSTVEDLFRWDRTRARGELLSPTSEASLFDPHSPNYGYGWALSTDSGAPVVWHGGRYPGFASCVVRYVQSEIFVALLSNIGQTPACDLARDLARLAAAS